MPQVFCETPCNSAGVSLPAPGISRSIRNFGMVRLLIKELVGRPGLNFLLQRLDNLGQRLGAEIAFAAMADGDRAGFSLFGPHDEHNRNLLQLRVADFCGQLLVAVVEMHAPAMTLERLGYVR